MYSVYFAPGNHSVVQYGLRRLYAPPRVILRSLGVQRADYEQINNKTVIKNIYFTLHTKLRRNTKDFMELKL